MKTTSINVQITKCPKQYEAVRLGMEASLDTGETVEGAIKAATAQLNALYVEMYQQKPKDAQNAEKAATNEKQDTKPAREKLTFEDARLQAIIKRMERQPENVQKIYDQTLAYFEPTEDAMKVLKLAARII